MRKLIRFACNQLMPRLLVNVWLMAKYRCVVHPGASILFPGQLTIGRGSIIGKCQIIAQGPIRIGEKCFVNDHVILNSKTGWISIGDQTSINHFSAIFGNGGVEIGTNCAIGLNVQIIKNHVIPDDLSPGYPVVTEGRTVVGDSVWLCSNVVIVDGVEIGSYSVVGANSLVSRSLPMRSISAGCPAKVLRMREDASCGEAR